MIKNRTVSASLTDDEIMVWDGLVAKLGKNRSRSLGTLLRFAEKYLAAGGSLDAPPAGTDGCGVAAAVVGAVESRPGTGADAIGLAAAVAGRRIDELRAGVLPMVDADAAGAGLNPHSRETYRLYTKVLPGIFRDSLGVDAAPVIRYSPLAVVNGEHFGAIRGTVTSHQVVYPDSDGTGRYVQMSVRNARQEMVVMVPAGQGADGASPGLKVYVPGVFESVRGSVRMSAESCLVCRVAGFGMTYGIADRWGVDNAVAGRAVAMLRRVHRSDAAVYDSMFAGFLELRSGYMGFERDLPTPGGSRLTVLRSEAREAPDGAGAFAQCTELWPAIVSRARRSGTLPLPPSGAVEGF